MTERICKICGKSYKVCTTCNSIKTFSPWRLLVCNAQEYQLFAALSRFDYDKDAVAASQALNQIGLDDADIANYIPSVQEQINKIKKTKKPRTKQRANTEN